MKGNTSLNEHGVRIDTQVSKHSFHICFTHEQEVSRKLTKIKYLTFFQFSEGSENGNLETLCESLVCQFT